MGINKIVYGGNTLIDLTDSTLASADQLAQGITAYDRTGTKITGTATGGGAGAVIQDEDGGLHFLEDGTNAFSDAIETLPNGGLHHIITGVMASDGLEYEEGTYTPSVDTAQPSITFTNTHTMRPFCVVIQEAENSLADANSYLFWMIVNFTDLYGKITFAENSWFYARMQYGYRLSNTSSVGGVNIATESSINTYITSSGFNPYYGTSYYYRSGRTYKWIAVWR